MSVAFATLAPVHKLSVLRRHGRHRTVVTCGENSPHSASRRHLLRAMAALPLLTFPNFVHARNTDSDRLYDCRSGSFLPSSAMPALLRRDVGYAFDRCIVAAEVHDNLSTHAAQLAVIDGARRLPDGMPLTVGFEQFYRQHDSYLDQYVNRKLSLAGLLQKTNWDNTWGFDVKLYAPIFEYCRIHRLPMVGLNVPYGVVQEVSRVGLNGLPQDLKDFLPNNMDIQNKQHYDHFMELLGVQGPHRESSETLDRFYEAQVLWEEWMSQSVALSLEKRPGTRMVALIGSGHVEGRYGFPDRIEKRCNQRPYTVIPRPVRWTSEQGLPMPEIPGPEQNVADLIWYTRRTIDRA